MIVFVKSVLQFGYGIRGVTRSCLAYALLVYKKGVMLSFHYRHGSSPWRAGTSCCVLLRDECVHFLQFNVQRPTFGSLNFDMLGAFTPWKLACATNQAPSGAHQCSFSARTCSHSNCSAPRLL